MAGEREHHGEGVFGDGNGVGSGRVHDHNALLGSGVEIDIVYAHSGAADDAEFGGVIQKFCVQIDGGANDQRVGVFQLGGEVAIKLVSSEDVPIRFLAEEFDGGRRSFFSDDDLHLGFAVADL